MVILLALLIGIFFVAAVIKVVVDRATLRPCPACRERVSKRASVCPRCQTRY